MHQHAPEAEQLLRLPYHISLVRDGQGDDERCWTARVEELPAVTRLNFYDCDLSQVADTDPVPAHVATVIVASAHKRPVPAKDRVRVVLVGEESEAIDQTRHPKS